MKTGYADVVKPLHTVAEKLSAQSRFFGDGDVGGSGADDHDQAVPPLWSWFCHHTAEHSVLTVLQSGSSALDLTRLVRREPSNDQALA